MLNKNTYTYTVEYCIIETSEHSHLQPLQACVGSPGYASYSWDISRLSMYMYIVQN